MNESCQRREYPKRGPGPVATADPIALAAEKGSRRNKMIKMFGFVGAVLLVGSGCLSGQSLLDQVNFKSGSVGGLHLNGIGIYSGYSTSLFPLSSGLGVPPPAFQSIGGDIDYGVNFSLGWQHHRGRTNFSLLYSGGFTGLVRNSDLNGRSQSLSFGYSRQLGPKWSFHFAGTGQDNTRIQLLSQPSSLSVVSQLPLSFDDLAATFSISNFTNAQVANQVLSSPQFDSPAKVLLVGNRAITYSADAGLTYSYSSRLSVQLSGFSAAGQFRIDTGQPGAATQFTPLPRSTGLNAGVGISYSLSPRTTVGLSANESYVTNRYQSAYVTTGSVSIGRKMGQHWFLSAFGGGSVTHAINQVFAPPATTPMVGGGSIGLRTYQHTFVASYSRTGADPYGFAAGNNASATGTWSWRRPGSKWSVQSSAGQQQIRGNGFADLSGWTVSGGIAASLDRQTSVGAQYSYTHNSGMYLGAATNLAVHTVRVSLDWTPQPVVR